MTARKRECLWIAGNLVPFAAGLAASWQRWGNLLVDCGREMNQPARLAAGEMLYSQVRHIYGPLSPYLNALLFKVAGTDLSVLYADGIVSALAIVALVYGLSRRLMRPLSATAATQSVIWLCAFKAAGNFILPYSYGALHGCLLGLVALGLQFRFITTRRLRYLGAAGIAAGLALLAKTEMGLAAVLSGIACAAIVGEGTDSNLAILLGAFAAPALVLPAAVYSAIARITGLKVLVVDSYLFFTHVPPELLYFNKRMSGFDHPLLSVSGIVVSAVRFGGLAVLACSVSIIGARSSRGLSRVEEAAVSRGSGPIWKTYLLAALALAAIVASLLVGRQFVDIGPYMAVPILLFILLGFFTVRFVKKGRPGTRSQLAIVLVVYSLASLTRIMLRVRSGGAYASYLIPSSVIVFTYCWIEVFPRFLSSPRARLIARRVMAGLILTDMAINWGLISHRYRATNTYRISTSRGTLYTSPDLGLAFDHAIHFIDSETAPGDAVAVFPEGTSLDFLTGRRNPLREEILTPGFLDEAGQERAIGQLSSSNTRLVLVTNRPTAEFDRTYFGLDYYQTLMSWVRANYDLVAVFGPPNISDSSIGGKTFFIKAYVKKGVSGGSHQPSAMSGQLSGSTFGDPASINQQTAFKPLGTIVVVSKGANRGEAYIARGDLTVEKDEIRAGVVDAFEAQPLSLTADGCPLIAQP